MVQVSVGASGIQTRSFFLSLAFFFSSAKQSSELVRIEPRPMEQGRERWHGVIAAGKPEQRADFAFVFPKAGALCRWSFLNNEKFHTPELNAGRSLFRSLSSGGGSVRPAKREAVKLAEDGEQRT